MTAMEEPTAAPVCEQTSSSAACQTTGEVPQNIKTEVIGACDINVVNKDESGIVLDSVSDKLVNVKDSSTETCEIIDDNRSFGDLDSLPVGDELVLGAAGSDSGVEGCGRALSSGGGSQSCASSVVSCGSGCGSESSSLAGAPPRPRRRVNLTEPKRSSPVGTSTPRPVTAPRGPNLATRERARSREKPVPPEKPRPLTPKPRIRPTADLPNLVRESPALRAKPTKTSTARCRTPNSPTDEKKWPTSGPRLASTDTSAAKFATDKYATLPRRRRENDVDGSPKHESTPPISRRPTVTRSASSRSTVKTRVRIYAEKTSQTVLLGTDIESALAGIVPNIENHVEVSRCHKGVQASSRDSEISRLTGALAAAQASASEEAARREHVEQQLATERAARLAAVAETERNSQRLLDLAGAGAGAGTDGCLRILEEQLREASELAARQRKEIDTLRTTCDKLHAESRSVQQTARSLEARLAEAEREAAEMQDFLAAETGALSDSLREAEAELVKTTADLDRCGSECRQLVRMCEQRRQEALSWRARARPPPGLPRALRALRARVAALGALLGHQPHSESAEVLTPEEECRGGLLAAVARALRAEAEDDRSRLSDDNSADLLDSETEPCLVTDPDCAEEWWSGAEGCEGAWSTEELSPERESVPDIDRGESESCEVSEQESLRNLSLAIAMRHRSEAGQRRAGLTERVLELDAHLSRILRSLHREKLNIPENNVADVVAKKLAELDSSKNMMDQYRQSVDAHKKQRTQSNEDEDLEFIEEELSWCGEEERRDLYCALDAALGALAPLCWRPAGPGCGPTGRDCGPTGRGGPRLLALRARLERLAFAVATPPREHKSKVREHKRSSWVEAHPL